jgi:hypothetical protein
MMQPIPFGMRTNVRVTDPAAERVFLCVREPSMVLVARLPALGNVVHGRCPRAVRSNTRTAALWRDAGSQNDDGESG